MSNTTRTSHYTLAPLLCLLLTACSGAPEREVNYGDITRSPELKLPAGLSAPDTSGAMTLPHEVDQVATSDNAGLLVLPPPSELSVEGVPTAEPVANQVQRARLEQDAAGLHLSVEESFARAWRHTGIALDAIGLVVDDRDRSQGLYYVTVIGALQKRRDGDGWFNWLGSDGNARVKRRVQLLRKSEESTLIYLFDEHEQPMDESQTRPLLELLAKQLNG